MSGALLQFSLDGGDLVLGELGLELDSGIATLVAVSLLSDARARAEDLVFSGYPDDYQDLRGWWADTDEDRFGSRLWLLARAKRSPETRARAEEYVRDALRWVVDEGVAERVEVEAIFEREGFASPALCLSVRIVRGSARRWADLWKEPIAIEHAANGLTLAVEAS